MVSVVRTIIRVDTINGWHTVISTTDVTYNVQVSLYDNERQFWIVVVGLRSVDRPAGLAAYMSLLLQANDVVRAFRLSKVVEHWDITPGNGNAYYARALLCCHAHLCTSVPACLAMSGFLCFYCNTVITPASQCLPLSAITALASYCRPSGSSPRCQRVSPCSCSSL